MRKLATGRLGRVIFAHLAPGDDIYKAVLEIAQQEGIKAGVILDMTGAASQLRLSLPTGVTEAHRPPGMLEVSGLAEIMGSGIIGYASEDFVSADGHVRYQKGEPYLHLHVSATVNGQTYTGHLIEGTLVRSVIPRSHFTMAIAEVEGVELSMLVDTAATDDYPAGILYHELRETQPSASSA
jgi:predicted DNA-binding protein with PD1-like motif